MYLLKMKEYQTNYGYLIFITKTYKYENTNNIIYKIY